MNTENDTQVAEVQTTWRDENGNVDVDAVREVLECGEPIDHEVEQAMLAALDEIERLRAANGPSTCHASLPGQPCRPKICTYGTTSASLGDYNGKFGDTGFEAYLARCVRCGAPFAGIAPSGVYSDEPGFESSVQWTRIPYAPEGGAL